MYGFLVSGFIKPDATSVDPDVLPMPERFIGAGAGVGVGLVFFGAGAGVGVAKGIPILEYTAFIASCGTPCLTKNALSSAESLGLPIWNHSFLSFSFDQCSKSCFRLIYYVLIIPFHAW